MAEAGAAGSGAAGLEVAGWAEAGLVAEAGSEAVGSEAVDGAAEAVAAEEAEGWAEEDSVVEDSAEEDSVAEDWAEEDWAAEKAVVSAAAGWAAYIARACTRQCASSATRGTVGTHLGGGLAIISAVICEKPTLPAAAIPPVLAIPITRVIVMFTWLGVPETGTVTGFSAAAML